MKIANILVSIIFLLFLSVSLFFVYRLFYGEQGDTVIVPNIIGMDVYSAKESVKIVDLKVEVVSSTFSDKPVNVIVKQYPEPGMEVKKNGIIKVVVSRGKKELQEELPDLVGRKLSEIKSDPIVNTFLKKYNLSLKIIYYPTLLLDNERIILQSIIPDSSKGRIMEILVSKTEDPNLYIKNSYSKINQFLYDVKVDGILIDLDNTDENDDRNIQDIEIYNNNLIVEADLNYSQIPSIKITSIYVKPQYAKGISLLEVILSDFLGTRTILRQYYTGIFVCNLQVFYIGEGRITINIDGKKVSSYALP
ncbi:MAG: PASTA domain-containing protein [Candidatus Calescibacterium sp.]|nr:PASTA domain-containing protein [Candidatus Calescibacterium sp.]MCX7972445.1 PASTA domain-containing protein [bacterium]MDW8195664.1 PASTA domain-containing protein [Candidatus Calescibacterium sp.]